VSEKGWNVLDPPGTNGILYNSEDYGHFAEMNVDKNFAIGCSIMRFTRPDYPSVFIYNFICNYASLYALGAPVYETGRAASRCTTGKSHFYPGLCSTREVYDPNW